MQKTSFLFLTATPQDLKLPPRPLLLSKDLSAPKEVRLFAFGLNKTIYGDLYLTPESAKACLDYEAYLGRDLAWDWHHYSEPTGPKAPKPEDSGAAGWFSLAVKADGIYASIPAKLSQDPILAAKCGIELPLDGIGWLPTGRENVENLKFRYFSPGIQIDKKKQIVGITSCALTNTPATREQQPLLCSQGLLKMTWEQILAALIARGATQEEIDRAKADFDAASAAAQTPNETPAPVQAQNLSAPATPATDVAERRRLILLAYSNRFQTAERPHLERMEPEVLEGLLSARTANPLHQPAQVPASRPAVTGGNNPLTWQGRPLEQLNSRNRHALLLTDPNLYRQMFRQAEDQRRDITTMLASAEMDSQPLLLATGITTSTDTIDLIPQVLNPALEAGLPGLRQLLGSDVVIYDGGMPSFMTGIGRVDGGSIVTIPTYNELGEFQLITAGGGTEGAPATNKQKLETDQVTATVLHSSLGIELTYSARAFAGMARDPYNEASRQILIKAKNHIEDALITEARTTSLSSDITAVADGKLTYDSIVDALALWGDEEFENNRAAMAMTFMHSNSLKEVRKIKDSTGQPIFYSAQDGNPPSLFGKPSRISDRLTQVSTNEVMLFAKPRALMAWVNEGKIRLETFKDVEKDSELSYVHLYFAVKLLPHVVGGSKKGVVKLIHK